MATGGKRGKLAILAPVPYRPALVFRALGAAILMRGLVSKLIKKSSIGSLGDHAQTVQFLFIRLLHRLVSALKKYCGKSMKDKQSSLRVIMGQAD